MEIHKVPMQVIILKIVRKKWNASIHGKTYEMVIGRKI